MPQVIFFGLLLLLGFYCWHVLKRELAKLEEADRQSAKAQATAKRTRKREAIETLHQDPQTGVYRLDDD